ncbi:MAG: zinc ribbon domain-containing protein [Phycisphaerae bacterium]|nr:zinc ribbon domain-containing protein [Phycisphaerae bacterium]
MPTYDYECNACGHKFEKFQSITARSLRTCPRCKKAKLRRLIGPGAGFIFRGSGFYQTDYRSESYRKAAEKEKAAADNKPPKDASKGAGEDPSKPKPSNPDS